jgi:hypothetical protein
LESVLSMGFECPFCPCVFVCEEDLNLHLKTFKSYPHLEDWRQTHRDLEFQRYRLHGGADRKIRIIVKILELYRERGKSV